MSNVDRILELVDTLSAKERQELVLRLTSRPKGRDSTWLSGLPENQRRRIVDETRAAIRDADEHPERSIPHEQVFRELFARLASKRTR